ncbi:MAG: NifB/NifX family molybdenum-iron cluster-binding protein, partial [Gemmatimonadota bacterium]
MKIGVSARDGSLDAAVEPRFGRCPDGVVVDSESMTFDAFANEDAGGGGAGPRTVQAFASRGAQVILTGRVGPNAQEALQAASLEVVTGVSGTVRQAVESYLKTKGVNQP